MTDVDSFLCEFDTLLNVQPVQVDRPDRLHLVVLVEDPLGRLVVVLVLQPLMLLALDAQRVRRVAVARLVRPLTVGKTLCLFTRFC